jgi:hypothetical protein
LEKTDSRFTGLVSRKQWLEATCVDFAYYYDIDVLQRLKPETSSVFQSFNLSSLGNAANALAEELGILQDDDDELEVEPTDDVEGGGEDQIEVDGVEGSGEYEIEVDGVAGGDEDEIEDEVAAEDEQDECEVSYEEAQFEDEDVIETEG